MSRQAQEVITASTVDELAQAAVQAFDEALASTSEQRADWLIAVAEAIEANIDDLVALADEETRLGTARLTGEVGRTCGQLRLFAAAVLEGSYLEATIDHAVPGAAPPRPDLRRILRPLGPVAVFSASNFPFAFSVAGGDTASALAAGCPVIVKGHSAHPRLSERTAEVVAAALAAAGAPDGIFAHVLGREAGRDLVRHPEVRAVGFTGSLGGGRALFDLACSRPDPIPFYGELGAVNPVVITPAAVAARSGELAAGLAGSFTLGAGQFCTNPGLVFVPAASGFADLVAGEVASVAAAPMLSEAIADAFSARVIELAGHPGVTLVAGPGQQCTGFGAPVVLTSTIDAVHADPGMLLEECFGPSTLIVEYRALAEVPAVIRLIGGTLTASVHAEPGEDLSSTLAAFERVAGRVVVNGWPTGVAVNWAQHHGGPWPATTSVHTSVGATAIRRFLRPVAFQDVPDAALPPALQDANPLGIPRRIDGALTLPH